LKVVSVEQMRELERRMAERGVPEPELMERAGLGFAREVERCVGPVKGQSVLALIGPGNNGGDGLVASRHLQAAGASVTAYLWHRRADDQRVKEARLAGVKIVNADEDHGFATLRAEAEKASVAIDALFGIGRLRPFGNDLRAALDIVRRSRHPAAVVRGQTFLTGLQRLAEEPVVFAVDVPSGVDADSGEADESTLAADVTVTFGFPKVGLFAFPARALTGGISVVDIGMPEALADDIHLDLLTGSSVAEMLPRRPLDANKGTFGRALIFAGSLHYIGAAYLAAAAAGRVGAGLVTLSSPRSLLPILASKLTETTYEPLDESEPGVAGDVSPYFVRGLVQRYHCLLLGCGLGQLAPTASFVLATLRVLQETGTVPLVLDADGLNVVSKRTDWPNLLPPRTVLTPHPGEMARLTGLPIDQVLRDRLAAARNAAQEWRSVVVLKGAHTIVAEPDGSASLSPFANPALATAGTGDVLAGAIVGLLAQGLKLENAAKCGVYLHGLAGELASAAMGDTGVIAGDLLPRLPLAIRQLRLNE